MNGIKRLTIVVAAAATVLAGGAVYAQASTEYLALVRDNCSGLKQTVESQRKHDLVTRINKGRAYQTVLDQQQAFSQRLRNNKLTADQFVNQTTEIQAGVERFRSAYNRYDDAMSMLAAIDCQTQPQEFTDQLFATRSLRAGVGNEVATIDASLTHYRQTVVAFQQEIDRLNKAVSEGAP